MEEKPFLVLDITKFLLASNLSQIEEFGSCSISYDKRTSTGHSYSDQRQMSMVMAYQGNVQTN